MIWNRKLVPITKLMGNEFKWLVCKSHWPGITVLESRVQNLVIREDFLTEKDWINPRILRERKPISNISPELEAALSEESPTAPERIPRGSDDARRSHTEQRWPRATVTGRGGPGPAAGLRHPMSHGPLPFLPRPRPSGTSEPLPTLQPRDPPAARPSVPPRRTPPSFVSAEGPPSPERNRKRKGGEGGSGPRPRGAALCPGRSGASRAPELRETRAPRQSDLRPCPWLAGPFLLQYNHTHELSNMASGEQCAPQYIQTPQAQEPPRFYNLIVSPGASVPFFLLLFSCLPALCSSIALASPYPKGRQSPAPAVIPRCPFTWLQSPVFMSFVIPKAGHSWPLVSSSNQEPNLHFNRRIAGQDAWVSIPQRIELEIYHGCHWTWAHLIKKSLSGIKKKKSATKLIINSVEVGKKNLQDLFSGARHKGWSRWLPLCTQVIYS